MGLVRLLKFHLASSSVRPGTTAAGEVDALIVGVIDMVGDGEGDCVGVGDTVTARDVGVGVQVGVTDEDGVGVDVGVNDGSAEGVGEKLGVVVGT